MTQFAFTTIAEVTIDLPKAGSTEGQLLIAIPAVNIDQIELRVLVPFKHVWAVTAALAVVAFAAVGSHRRQFAGTGAIVARGKSGQNLYLEAQDAAAVVTNGVSYETQAFPG